MTTQKEKRTRIVTMLENLPEHVLDQVLKLLQKERETAKVIEENVIDRLTKKQVVKPPITQKRQRVRHTPMKVDGKPLSEIIIEDRR